jgi:hypothetical protein
VAALETEKRKSWKNETLCHASPCTLNADYFSAIHQVLLFFFPSFPSSRQSGGRSHHLWLSIPKQFPHHGYPSLAKKRATVLTSLHCIQADLSLEWDPTVQKAASSHSSSSPD